MPPQVPQARRFAPQLPIPEEVVMGGAVSGSLRPTGAGYAGALVFKALLPRHVPNLLGGIGSGTVGSGALCPTVSGVVVARRIKTATERV